MLRGVEGNFTGEMEGASEIETGTAEDGTGGMFKDNRSGGSEVVSVMCGGLDFGSDGPPCVSSLPKATSNKLPIDQSMDE